MIFLTEKSLLKGSSKIALLASQIQDNFVNNNKMGFGNIEVMIDGPPFMIYRLETTLATTGFKVLYPFSKKKDVETINIRPKYLPSFFNFITNKKSPMDKESITRFVGFVES